MVEQWPFKPTVGGSSPSGCTTRIHNKNIGITTHDTKNPPVLSCLTARKNSGEYTSYRLTAEEQQQEHHPLRQHIEQEHTRQPRQKGAHLRENES